MGLDNPEDIINALSEVYVFSEQIVSEHSKRNWGAHRVSKVERSDKDPPNLRSTWTEVIPDFDGVLGEYNNRIRKITLYKKAICWFAAAREWHPMHLEKVVELHECAHALHHLGPASPVPAAAETELKQRNLRYRKIPDELKEQIAQLMTLLAIRGQAAAVRHSRAKSHWKTMEQIFVELMRNQSPKYQLSELVLQTKSTRLEEKTNLIIQLSDQGCYPSSEQINGIFT